MAYNPSHGKLSRESERSNLGASLSAERLGEYSFRAGRMHRKDSPAGYVTAERTKGLVYLERSSEDELLHWRWQNRETGEVEDDLIVFPEDAEFRFIKEAKGDRVFALYFRSSGQLVFYWMQSKNDAMDQRHFDSVNAILASNVDADDDDDDAAAAGGGASPLELRPKKGADPNAYLQQAAGDENAQARALIAPGGHYAGLDVERTADTMHVRKDQVLAILNSKALRELAYPGRRFSHAADGAAAAAAVAAGSAGGVDDSLYNDDGDVDMRDIAGAGAGPGGAGETQSNPHGDGAGLLQQLASDMAQPTRAGVADPSGVAMPSAGQQAAIAGINDDRKDMTTDQLRTLLSSIRVPASTGSGSTSGSGAGAGSRSGAATSATAARESGAITELGQVLTPSIIQPLLADAAVRRALFPHLPSELVSSPVPTEAEVQAILATPQWRTALRQLSTALNNGGPVVIRALGLDANLVHTDDEISGVELFLRAVSEQVRSEGAQGGTAEGGAGGAPEDNGGDEDAMQE